MKQLQYRRISVSLVGHSWNSGNKYVIHPRLVLSIDWQSSRRALLISGWGGGVITSINGSLPKNGSSKRFISKRSANVVQIRVRCQPLDSYDVTECRDTIELCSENHTFRGYLSSTLVGSEQEKSKKNVPHLSLLQLSRVLINGLTCK